MDNMFVEILVADKRSLNKLILSALECKKNITTKLRFILEVNPEKGVYIIADSNETDLIPTNDLKLMLTSCGTGLLKRKSIRGYVQIHNRKRYIDEF